MPADMDSFPGGTALTHLRVYDWPAQDGRCGGSPHLHTASTEAYVVLAGEGAVETLSGQGGHAEHVLGPGSLLWFTPGTVHRLVNGSGDLEILVVMQNAGLPEAGDAVLTFPPDVLADPSAYRKAVAKPARERRDLAMAGFVELRAGVQAHGPEALTDLYQAAGRLVRERVTDWQRLWQQRVSDQVERTRVHLERLAEGDPTHLGDSAVHSAPRTTEEIFGMCGRLQVWRME